MAERLFCTINQQPCGIDGLGDGVGNCGDCIGAEKFLSDIFEVLRLSGAVNFWTRDEGDTIIAGYRNGVFFKKGIPLLPRLRLGRSE